VPPDAPASEQCERDHVHKRPLAAMPFLVALAADGDQILGTLVAFSLVGLVVNLEVGAGAAVLAESVSAVERHLAAQLPSGAP
jgi:hypothetical protein